METLKVNMMVDARTATIVDENLEAITGLITLFRDVPVLIELALFDMEGKPFAEDCLNQYEWGFVVANDYNKETAPQLRANAIAVVENVLKIEITNMNTIELNSVLGDEKSVRLGAELTGKKADVDNWVIQFNVSVRNRRNSAGIPTPVAKDYYTKVETDCMLEDKTDVVYVESELVKKANVTDIPTDVSVLENDAGYITIDDIPEIDLELYALKTDLPDLSNYSSSKKIFLESSFNNVKYNLSIDDKRIYLSNGWLGGKVFDCTSNVLLLGEYVYKSKPTLILGNAVCAIDSAGTVILNRMKVNGGTVTTSYNATCYVQLSTYTNPPGIAVQGGTYHTITLTANTNCTLTFTGSAIHGGSTFVIVANNAAGGSLLFENLELLSNDEAGKYALFFTSIEDKIKFLNKVEV